MDTQTEAIAFLAALAFAVSCTLALMGLQAWWDNRRRKLHDALAALEGADDGK
jgi:hypothetical protein